MQENHLHHQRLQIHTHTYTNTHIKVYVCISACLRVPGVLQICLISKTNLSSELFSPSHCLLMICLYFNISESLQLRWKKTTWEDLKGILSLTSLCEGILSLSLNSSIADSCFWENQGVAPGRQRKGIDGVETSRNVKGKEQRRRFGGLWWRFKQKEISNSSKSLTPCAERPGMHLRIRDCGHAYILLVQNHSVLIHPTRYQPLCIFIFFPLFFLFGSGNWHKLWGYIDMLSTNSEFRQILHFQNVKGLTPKLPQYFSKLKGSYSFGRNDWQTSSFI